MLLQSRGFRVWYDNDQLTEDRNLEGMKAGVRESACLLIFLSGRSPLTFSTPRDELNLVCCAL